MKRRTLILTIAGLAVVVVTNSRAGKYHCRLHPDVVGTI